MGRLLSFEFRKLFRSKYFYILLVISIVLVIITGFTYMFLSTLAGILTSGLVAVSSTPYEFAKSILSNNFSIIAAIFVSLIATEDFSHTTIKNIFSKGYSRVSVFFSKYFVSLIACLIIATVNVGAAYGIGYYLFEDKAFNEETMTLIYVILGQILSVIAYQTMYFFIAYTSRKVGLGIALNILIPLIVVIILTLGDTALQSQNIDITISDYWIDNVLRRFSDLYTDEDLLIQNFVTLGAYVVSFFTAGLVVNSRKEV